MNPFNNFSMQIYTPEMIDALEEELLSVNERPSVDWSRGKYHEYTREACHKRETYRHKR